MNRRLRLGLLTLAVLLLQGCAVVMQSADCDRPTTRGAMAPAVYLVTLPYAYKGKQPNARAQKAVEALNQLAHAEVLRMAADTVDMHVTQLRDQGNGCRIEEIYSAYEEGGLLSNRVRANVVFFWGEVYADGDRITVQSNVRVLWKDEDAKSIWIDPSRPSGLRAGVPTKGESYPFWGKLPYTSIAFPSRPLGQGLTDPGTLAQLPGGWDSMDMKNRMDIPAQFTIARRTGEWVELQNARLGRPSVWVRVGKSGEAAAGTLLLPELSFANAVAGFANFRKYGALNPSVARDMSRRFDEFRRVYASEGGTDLRNSMAAADVIQGFLELTRDDDGAPAHRKKAAQLFDRALTATPADSNTLNLSAMADIASGCCASRQASLKVQQQLELARQLDAGDFDIARNLITWYAYIRSQREAVLPEPRAELDRRREALKKGLCDAGICAHLE